MSKDHAEKINTAINRCLDEVCTLEEPSRGILQFLSRLRRDPRWSDWEVREVEEAVHHAAELIAR